MNDHSRMDRFAPYPKAGERIDEASNRAADRQRKGFFALLLVLMFLLYGYGFAANTVYWVSAPSATTQWPLWLTDSLLDAFVMGSLVALFRWSRNGLVALLVSSIAQMMYDYRFTQQADTLVHKIIPLILITALVINQWKDFE